VQHAVIGKCDAPAGEHCLCGFTHTDADPSAVAGQLCPQWLHDTYATTGPDGKTYPTWHPPVDPQYGCDFGHEHGADPRSAHIYTQMPPFGYAAATMGMTEPHAGFKVFVLNAGDSGEAGNLAQLDALVVFHMGTGGVARYTQEFHSFQLDLADRGGSASSAHVTGMTDTGPTSQNGSTCDNPRRGAKDFSTLGCPDSYEIWNFTKFQVIHPSDPFTGIDQTRFGMVPSFAAFDPITTRDPADNTRLVYTEDVRQNPGNLIGISATSPDAYFQGCRREFYAGPFYFHNAGQATVYYTDAMGLVSPNGPDAQHPIMQQVSATTASLTSSFKKRTDYCGNTIRPPN
jgi:hypothetical protein